MNFKNVVSAYLVNISLDDWSYSSHGYERENWLELEKPGSASGGVAGKMGKIPSLAVALLELYFI